MLTADLAFWPIIGFMVGCVFYFKPHIKGPRMAMQWGFDGKPTWTAPKALGIWSMVAVACLVRLVIWLGVTFTPDRVNRPEEGLLLSSIVLAAAHVWLLRRAARQA